MARNRSVGKCSKITVGLNMIQLANELTFWDLRQIANEATSMQVELA